jgi:serine/threonine protein kinase
MCYLHEHGIIHRDLKIANVMLDTDLYPLVGDFGLSRILPEVGKSLNEAITMTLAQGTPMYIAPELWKTDDMVTEGLYTTAVDVYAYAILLFELVTLARPWKDRKEFAIRQAVLAGERPEIPATVAPIYKKMIEACWVTNPEDRPTFRELIEQVTEQTSPEFGFPGTEGNDEFLIYQRRMLENLNEDRSASSI